MTGALPGNRKETEENSKVRFAFLETHHMFTASIVNGVITIFSHAMGLLNHIPGNLAKNPNAIHQDLHFRSPSPRARPSSIPIITQDRFEFGE